MIRLLADENSREPGQVTSPFTGAACDESPRLRKRPKSHDQLSIFRSREVGYGYVAQVGRVRLPACRPPGGARKQSTSGGNSHGNRNRIGTVGRSARPMTAEERKVIFASSLGTVFEWYDFYLVRLARRDHRRQFFSGRRTRPPAFIFALLAFAAGFAVRPFGALVFGRLGDLIGRKYTFLVTMTDHGPRRPSSSACCRATPRSASPRRSILIACRLLQGLALGGEYGGAATYVAEHAPQGTARLLHVVDPDDGDARPVPVAARHPRRCASA